jgi:hypothetical protein
MNMDFDARAETRKRPEVKKLEENDEGRGMS